MIRVNIWDLKIKNKKIFLKGLFLKEFKQKTFLRDSWLFKPKVQLTERIAALFIGVERTWNVERPILQRKKYNH